MKQTFFLSRPRILLAVVALVFFAACKKEIKTTDQQEEIQLKAHHDSEPSKVSARMAIDWYDLHLRTILHSNPFVSNIAIIRSFAYTGISLYEAVRFMNSHSSSIAGKVYMMPSMPAPDNSKLYSWPAAGNAALASITHKLFPGLTAANNLSIDSLENVYNIGFASQMSVDVFNRSQAFGRAIAQAVFDWSKLDNFNHANDAYVIPVFPGCWEKTPPAFANPAVPYFGNVRPFIAADTAGFAPPVIFAYSENSSSGFYGMVKDIYDVSKSLTTDQKNIALFWDDLGINKGYTPPGHAISILNQVMKKEEVKLGKAAEVYLKAGMSMWDGSIMCFRSKYKYNLVRPVTYIRKVIDPTWLPLIVTPPHPEYPAAHAYITSAIMLAVAAVLGDHHTFVDHTYDFLGYPSRTYHSFSAVGIESGMSRRFGGIHYLPSILVGINLGQGVGKSVGKIQTRESSDDDNEDESEN